MGRGHNTVIFSDLLTKFSTITLDYYLEGTQYGFTASAKERGEYKLVRITDINDGYVDWQTVPHCDCESSSNYLLYDNDILVARTGGTTGKSFLVNNTPSNAIYASYLIRLRPKQEANPLFIHAFLNSYNYWSQIAEVKAGSAQPNVNAEKLKKLVLPQCSIEIQNQVVDLIYSGKTENWPEIAKHIDNTLQQFNHIKAYQAELQTQQTLLAQLRQAILQEAVQGKLTERWRVEKRGFELSENVQVPGSSPSRTATQPETGADLLARIRAEKADLIRQGKLRKEKPLPPITDAEKPFELPEGWVWCRLGEICLNISAGSSPQCKEHTASNEEWGVIKMSAVSWGEFNPNENKALPDSTMPNREAEIKNGDFLMTRANTLELIARSVVVRETRPKLLLNDKTLRVDFGGNILKVFYNYYNNGPEAREFYISKSTGSSPSMKNISRDNIKLLPVPIPPLVEQQAIILQVKQLLARVSALETENKQQQAEVGRLMQAVLREAFSGKETAEPVSSE